MNSILHYNNYKNSSVIAQIPHHGAKKNWNTNILKDFLNCNNWFASAGVSKQYNHPSEQVIRDIVNHNRNCSWINEINQITIVSEIKWLTPVNKAK